MSSELLPCPLCAASVETNFANGIGWEILCETCDHLHVGYFSSEEELIKKWNYRPREVVLAQRIAELELEIDRVRAQLLEALE